VKEEKALPGFTTVKDQLLLGANAPGDYNSVSVLRAKGHLNSKTWVNASLFLKIDSPVIWF
jgi:hypothetical protein